jgi:FkbM family methyltransferase
MRNLIKKKLKILLKPYLFAISNQRKGYQKLGISTFDIVKFYNFSEKHNNIQSYCTNLFGKKIHSFNSVNWFYYSLKELFLDEVYKCKLINPQPYIIDCGANIGLSIIYFKQQFPNSRIIAFEPDKTQYQNLIANIKSFGISDVEMINKGVWKEEALLDFFPDGNLGGTLIQRNSIISSTFSEVQFVRLKDYLHSTIDFLKIDIEGAEYEVMKDIRDKLFNVKNLFLEYHGYADKTQDFHEIIKWISEAGFRYHIKYSWENQKHPFIEKRNTGWDQQLNVYCYR